MVLLWNTQQAAQITWNKLNPIISQNTGVAGNTVQGSATGSSIKMFHLPLDFRLSDTIFPSSLKKKNNLPIKTQLSNEQGQMVGTCDCDTFRVWGVLPFCSKTLLKKKKKNFKYFLPQFYLKLSQCAPPPPCPTLLAVVILNRKLCGFKTPCVLLQKSDQLGSSHLMKKQET